MKILLFAMALLSQCTSLCDNQSHTATNVKAIELPVGRTSNASESHLTNDNSQSFTTLSDNVDRQTFTNIIRKYSNHETTSSRLIIAIAREFKGIPYVAKTLENSSEENLIVNLRELDCTTYIESVLAIYECIKNKKMSFEHYCDYLRKIRYIDGTVSYPNRQHYFSEWIDENTKDGFVKEIQAPNPPFTSLQKLSINFMTTHTSLYPMLKQHPEMVDSIARMENRLSGKSYRYIPKSAISNTKLMRSTVHDGDIIAITTSKAGLDTSHIGIAVWHKDGLHMLNASQIHKKVVEEPMLLYQYMKKHPSQTGIRIIRVI